MKKATTVLKTAAVVAAAFLATAVVAGTIDQNDAFYTFYETVDSWVGGPLGIGLAITMMLMGGAIGVAKNSPMPALTGIAGAAFLTWGPDIIRQIMVGGTLV